MHLAVAVDQGGLVAHAGLVTAGRQPAGFEDVRLLDNGLEARIEDVLYPSTHDLVGRQGEEMTKRLVGEGDAQVGVEDERADR